MDDVIKKASEDILKLAPQIQEELINGFRSLKSGNQISYESEGANPQDITTELDHKIGILYINEIYKKYQNYLRLDSEEESERVGNGPVTLRIDPLDGTKHFFKGIPMIASTATLVEDETTKFSMVLDVFANNIYHATKGGGAYINDRKIKTSNASVNDSLSFVLYESPNSETYLQDTDTYNTFTKKLNAITQKSYRMRNFGLSSLSICLVADGSCPAYVDFSGTTKLYDVEAAAMIAREAGAIVGDIDGNRYNTLTYEKTSDKKNLTDNLLVANETAFNELSQLLLEDHE